MYRLLVFFFLELLMLNLYDTFNIDKRIFKESSPQSRAHYLSVFLLHRHNDSMCLMFANEICYMVYDIKRTTICFEMYWLL